MWFGSSAVALKAQRKVEKNTVFKLIKLLIIFKSEPIAAPIYVIMEFVAKGKLQEFLRKSRAEHYYGNLYG